MSDFAGLAARDIRPASNLDIYRDKTQNIQHIQDISLNTVIFKDFM